MSYVFPNINALINDLERHAASKRANLKAIEADPKRGRTTKRTKEEIANDRGEAHAYEMIAIMMRDTYIGHRESSKPLTECK